MLLGVLLSCSAIAMSTFWSFLTTELRLQSLLTILAWIMVGTVPMIGVGLWFYLRGKRILGELDLIRDQKRMLRLIKSSTCIRVDQVTAKLNRPPAYIKALVHDLAQKDLLHGYADWNRGLLYPTPALALRNLTQCPLCHHDLDQHAPGLVECPECGAQIFLGMEGVLNGHPKQN